LGYRYVAKGGPHLAKDHVSRRWLSLHADGKVSTIDAARFTTARKLGLQPRDIRLLELPIGYGPPALLSRDSAIVVCFESIRCILSIDRVIVTNPDDDKAKKLLEDLVLKLSTSQAKSATRKGAAVWQGMSRISSVAKKIQYGRGGETVELPFELKALEICFDHLVRAIDKDMAVIEKEAMPALDSLTIRIAWPDLDIIRKVKHKLARLKARIVSIHGVLDRFLAHDEDMHRLNLTAEELTRQANEEAQKMEQLKLMKLGQRRERGRAAGAQAVVNSRPGKPGSGFAASKRAGIDVSDGETTGIRLMPPLTPAPGTRPPSRADSHQRSVSVASVASSLNESDGLAHDSVDKAKAVSDSTGHSSSTLDSQDEAEVAEVEMLLEAYDMHLEHDLSKLQALEDFIQDTEDLVNVKLDQKRNVLISADVILMSNNVALGFMNTVAALLAMNIVPLEVQSEENTFNFVAISAGLGVYILWGIFMMWAVSENLIVT
jgi:hypothetical protein